ncbi:MAG: MBL fold metallo-hydrolase [Actinomycetota bacterium]
MRLHICGARGSTPAPGAPFVRYGGHTSCIAVARDGERPRLILDVGTGVRRVTELLGGEAFRGTILLGHLHWDHTQGLPFFSAGDRAETNAHLLLPAQSEPVALLERMISPPYFPIGPLQLHGKWRFEGIDEGDHEFDGFSVAAREIPHKGGRTFGYRISDGRTSFAYLSDHSPLSLGEGSDGLGEYHDAALALTAGVDLVVHDAQHRATEFPRLAFLGHSAAEYAVGLAREAGARRVLLFHHDPARTDDEIDALVASFVDGNGFVQAATEGSVIDLPG